MKRPYQVILIILAVLGYHLCIFGFRSANSITYPAASAFITVLYVSAFLYIVNMYIDIRGKIRKLLFSKYRTAK